MTADADPRATPAVASREGDEEALYAEWRAAVLEHERMCVEVDLYTPKDVYAAYLAARTRELEAARALRRKVAPLGLAVLMDAARPAPATENMPIDDPNADGLGYL